MKHSLLASKRNSRLAIILSLVMVISLMLPGAQAAPQQQTTPPTQAKKPTFVLNYGGFLSEPKEGDALAIAIEFLHANHQRLGLVKEDLSDITLVDRVVTPNTGITNLYLRQRHMGVGVFNGDINVTVMPDGRILSIGNQFIDRLAERAPRPMPAIDAVTAVRSVAGELELTGGADLRVAESLATPDRQMTITGVDGISLDDIPAKLSYVLLEDGTVRLAWDLVVRHPNDIDWYHLQSDATTGAIISKVNWNISHTIHENPDYHAEEQLSQALNPLAHEHAHEEESHQAEALAPDSYNVYAMPIMDPNFGSRTIEVDPADALASPFGWHDTNGAAGAEFTITRGNNVHAYQDTDDDDGSEGDEPNGGATLDFDFPVDLSQPPSTYIQASTVNLFYWNNIIHDVLYQYGFTETNGNFQVNNYGRGGTGNDDVRAEAHDGGGTNNANFSTPPDGQRPRMQMYLWNQTTPGRDGSFSNDIIVHEYGHGISNRLTGGPSNVSCLGNSEQAGEGWSDWYAIALTALPSQTGTTNRGMGAYVLGQPTTGPGIRAFPYNTDMTVDPRTYEDTRTAAVPHGVGSIWAAITWEVYWNLVNEYGFDPNFYTGTGGNNKAMALVTEGLRIQPCSPSFTDGRDAILAADVALNGGANQCLIWEGFAKRGLGFSANAGSSGTNSDNTEAFDMPTSCSIAVEPAMVAACSPTTLDYQVNIGLSGSVTLTAAGTPPGSTVTFTPNPITGPGVATMTLANLAASPAGTYNITVTGTTNSEALDASTVLSIATSAPSAPTLVSPANGAVDQPYSPAFSWNAASTATTYTLELAEDAGFSNIIYSVDTDETSHQLPISLGSEQTYFWRVSATNGCGEGTPSSAFNFTVRSIPDVLLVDDDQNTPDIGATYVSALDNLGIAFDEFDTGDGNAGVEPTSSELAPYKTVIWIGGESGFIREAGENALSTHLDNGACLAVIAQDYRWYRGSFTPFMDTYLGASSITQDRNHPTINGIGGAFLGYGPHTFTMPAGYTNYTDDLVPDADAVAIMRGSGHPSNAAATVGISKTTEMYQTMFMPFPLEAVSTAALEQALQTIVDSCAPPAGDPVADLSIMLDAMPASAMPGQPVTVTIDYMNSGPDAATNGTITATLPMSLTDVAISADPVLTQAGTDPYVWTFANMDADTSGVITITGMVEASLTDEETLGFMAEISSETMDEDGSDDSASGSIIVTPPMVQFGLEEMTMMENDGTVGVTLTISAMPYAPGSVEVTTMDGTAIAGVDYEAITETVTFDGSTMETIQLTILDRPGTQGTRTFTLHITPTSGVTASATAMMVHIMDSEDGQTYVVLLPYISR